MRDDPKNDSSDDSEAGEGQDAEGQVERMVPEPELGAVITEAAEEPNRRKRLKESGDDS